MAAKRTSKQRETQFCREIYTGRAFRRPPNYRLKLFEIVSDLSMYLFGVEF